jgi:hypothetical protein
MSALPTVYRDLARLLPSHSLEATATLSRFRVTLDKYSNAVNAVNGTTTTVEARN